MPIWKRSDEEKAAKAERKAERKAKAQQRADEWRANRESAREKRKADETDAMKALPQEGETLDGMFRTNDVIVKKHVLVTSRRVIIGFEARSAESIFYPTSPVSTPPTSSRRICPSRSWAATTRSSFSFQTAEDRDQLRVLISARLVAE